MNRVEKSAFFRKICSNYVDVNSARQSLFQRYSRRVMFVRTSKDKQIAGVVEFVQLVHNVRHPKTGVPTPQIIHHFGRKDQLDLDALRRLIKSISRLLGPDGEAAARVLPGEEPEFEFLGSRQLGGTQLLDGLWKRLGIDEVITGMLARRGFTRPMERLLFAMVANRALDPGSKLAMENWVTEVACQVTCQQEGSSHASIFM